MKDISNEVVALLLVIAIVISVLGTWLVLDNAASITLKDFTSPTSLATRENNNLLQESDNNTGLGNIKLELIT